MTLPVGLDLDGRRVVVVGGGPTVLPGIRAVVGAGGLVHVLSPWVCEEAAALIATGEVAWSERDYAGPEDLDGAWLALAGSGEHILDAAVRTDAVAARLWCLDATELGAQLAAPATTPAPSSPRRERATAWLPATARVTTPDGTVTVAVHADDTFRAERTAGAVDDAPLAEGITRAVTDLVAGGHLDLRRRTPRTGPGWVALVGGGPGADGLLTTRGRELLASADVVVLDRLAPRAVVDRLPAAVRVVDVGKAPGRHALPQDRINDLLVEEALAGRAVVRLKGGDPYVLGRGGEERLACEAHGIRVEVVPGVTSAVSVPAAAGIPVTHRGVARGFTVVTGHDELPDVPPGTDHTVVVLMGVGRLARSARALVDAGRPATCPVAVVERGFAPDQRVTFGSLADIAATAAAVGVENPAVVVVGDVVRLSPDFPR
ncbi:uroporphyrinogen-III C-methyltransferase [Fodinibacter luteus]|uniref:uroporphyrinogen-III C-methyltransferase n=1 Tax=Fodinibacter luteus TaxID=552064 RepID=A0ABP8KG51_9MICO